MRNIPSYRLGDVPGAVGLDKSDGAKPRSDSLQVKQSGGSVRSAPLRRKASSIGSFMQKLESTVGNLRTLFTRKYQKPALDLLVPHASGKVEDADLDRASPQARMLNQLHGQAALDHLENNKDLLRTKPSLGLLGNWKDARRVGAGAWPRPGRAVGPGEPKLPIASVTAVV